MSSIDKCIEDTEKNPFTQKCVIKCPDDQIRFIDIENEIFSCKNITDRKKQLEELSVAQLEIIKRGLLEKQTPSILKMNIDIKTISDQTIKDNLIKDFGLKQKVIDKWDRKILEKEYLKRLNKKTPSLNVPIPAPIVESIPAPIVESIPAPIVESIPAPIVESIQLNEDESSKKNNSTNNTREKEEYNALMVQPEKENNFLYPNLNDPNFNIKIAEKKEFNDTQYDGDIRDIKEYSDILCNAEFELSPHQLFVRNFLSFQTPYNSLLLYHGLGSGKTCSAISVSEEMRDYLKQLGLANKIMIVASPNVQNNFRLQLFDERKLNLVDGLWNIRSCTGNKFLKEFNPFNMKGLSRDNIIYQVQQIINKYYIFFGYIEFANYISNSSSIDGADKDLTTKQKNNLIKRKLKRYFNNRLVIIDEVHNIRVTDDNLNKRVAQELFKLVKNVDNLRLLLLSATPMYNSYKEVIWLVNIMNLNDKRPTITVNDVFNNDGTFKISKDGEEIGKKLLERKATGYISFVRGENPYTFPYRIWPHEFSKKNTFEENVYPRNQLNGKPVIQGIELISLFLNDIGDYQSKGYSYIIDKLKKEIDKDKKNISFETMESFGYTLLQKPLEALNIVYPDERLNAITADSSDIPDIDTRELVGKGGLSRIMNYEILDKTLIRHKFNYKDEKKYGRIFSRDQIKKYSGKISNICERIINSKGVILVYSQYIDGGVLPIALALEELGFIRARGGINLFETPPTEQIDAITFESKSDYNKRLQNLASDPSLRQIKPFQGATYVMITGDKGFSPDSNSDIKELTNDNNSDGRKVKVVLISQAGSEGVDLKFIRQVHILDPWYNMNRIEQIIGRAVRNCSHKMLPFLQRNVEIYLYGSLLKNKEEEAADLYVYRLAEMKAIQIGHISRVLKEIAIDCILNYKQMYFNVENMIKNGIKPVNLELSSGGLLKYQIGDKPYSSTCDYMKKCDYTCNPSLKKTITDDNINTSTYGHSFISTGSDMIVYKIKELFKERFFYRKEDLIKQINSVKYNPIEKINYALTQLIDDNYEYITDKYGRLGNLINIADLYMFQPSELNNNAISIYDRSIPIDYKHDKVTITLPSNKFNPEDLMPKNIGENKEKTQSILKQMKENYNIAKDEERIEIEQKDVKELSIYNFYGIVINEFHNVDEMDLTLLLGFLVAHIIEELTIQEIVFLLNYMDELDRDNEFENKVFEYLDNQLLRDKNITGITLYDDNNKRIIMIKDNETGIWKKGEKEDENDLSEEIKKVIMNLLPAKKNLTQYIGFMSYIKKNNIFVFKIKDLKNKRAKGTRCDQSTKIDAIIILNLILSGKENMPYKQNTTILQKLVCCKQEFMLRYYDSIKKDKKRWFLTPTESNLIDIEKLSY